MKTKTIQAKEERETPDVAGTQRPLRARCRPPPPSTHLGRKHHNRNKNVDDAFSSAVVLGDRPRAARRPPPDQYAEETIHQGRQSLSIERQEANCSEISNHMTPACFGWPEVGLPDLPFSMIRECVTRIAMTCRWEGVLECQAVSTVSRRVDLFHFVDCNATARSCGI